MVNNRIEEVKEKIRQSYHYVQLLREHFASHSWCRQQTQYDSKFIADFNHRLMNMSNQIYELTQQLFPQPLDDKELREKLQDTYGVIRYGSNAYERYKSGRSIPDDWALFQYELDRILALLQPKILEAIKEVGRCLTLRK